MIEKLKEALFKRKALERDYHETFGTEHGKRVLSHIMRVSGLTKPVFHTDEKSQDRDVGARRLAFSIYRMVHTSGAHTTQLEEEIRKELENEHPE